MPIFVLLCYLAAVICFLISAFSGNPARINLVALGLAFLTAPLLAAAIVAV